MPGFDINQHLTARHGRIRIWNSALALAIIVTIVTLYLILAYGASASMAAKIAIAAVIVANTLFAVLQTRVAIKELGVLNADTVKDLEGTKYADNLQSVPLSGYEKLLYAVFCILAVTQLFALFTA